MSTEPSISVDLHSVLGLGVVGNFAGHLAQAGEDKFFQPSSVEAPKGLFPFYVPGDSGFLGVYPFSSEHIRIPDSGGNLQAEPELALLCDVSYSGKTVSRVTPVAFAAHNDCSIRNNAPKISLKKNWGPESKGTAQTFLPIDRFEPGGMLDHFRIACYLERGGDLLAYGIDSAASSYSYFYRTLTDWIVETIATQSDAGTLEPLGRLFEIARQPPQILLSAGATRYTHLGETGWLKSGDAVSVVVYDGKRYTDADIEERLRNRLWTGDGLSILRQTAG